VLHLRKAGWDVIHAYDMDLSRASDRQILEDARRAGRTVVTLDADFHALLAVEDANGPWVVRIRKEALRENLWVSHPRVASGTPVTTSSQGAGFQAPSPLKGEGWDGGWDSK